MKSISSIDHKNLLQSLPSKLLATKEIKAVKVTQNKNSLSKKEHQNKSFTVVAIGASAGGLEAVTQLLKNLSPTTLLVWLLSMCNT
jgi:two-component system CheB/CheR fusion protein